VTVEAISEATVQVLLALGLDRMDELGTNIAGSRSKSVDEFAHDSSNIP
jgi:hypothetical protein